MQAFILHLTHDVLMKRTQDKVLKLLRKLHWEDEQVHGWILSAFTEVWEIKYENIGHLAGLVYDLQRYHPGFSVAVVDQVMEDVRIGMEVSGRLLTRYEWLTGTTGEHFQVQPAPNFDHQVPRRALHVPCRKLGSHL